jgi:hypothetical protein
MCDSPDPSKEVIIVKYQEALKHYDICYNTLENFVSLYDFKDRRNIPDEPYDEFFDKLNKLFKNIESNFVKAKKDYLKAKADYEAIKEK